MSRARWVTAVKNLCLALPFSPLAKKGTGSIFTYHRITDTPIQAGSFAPTRPLQVHRSDFETQIKFLSEECRCLSLTEGVEALKIGRLPNRAVFVTFDDGYTDTLKLALPILEKHQVPATVFLTVDILDRKVDPWWFELEHILSVKEQVSYNTVGPTVTLKACSVPEKTLAYRRINHALMRASPGEQEAVLEALRNGTPKAPPSSRHFMNWNEAEELSRHPLISIGSHTMSHPVLSSLSAADLVYELTHSKTVLEERLGREIPFLCYPFGSPIQAGRREYHAAKEAGYVAAFTTVARNLTSLHRTCLHALPRIDITYGESLTELKWKLKGFDTLVHRYAWASG